MNKEKRVIVPASLTFEEHCRVNGIQKDKVLGYWHKSKYYSLKVDNKPKTEDIELIKSNLIKDLNRYSPKYNRFKYKKLKDANLGFLSLADLHIGKRAHNSETGEDYNVAIAIRRALEGVDSLLSMSSGFKFDKMVLNIGNDLLHSDNSVSTTTKGTVVESDGLWSENFIKAKDLIVEIIEKMLVFAPVHCIHSMSNHDKCMGWALAISVESHFRLCKDVTFDNSIRDRKVFMYGKNMIGTVHMHGPKPQMINSIFASEYPVEWAASENRYGYGHHLHHKNGTLDLPGMSFETMRSLSGTDSYHSLHGYIGVPCALEMFVHDKTSQIAKFIYTINK